MYSFILHRLTKIHVKFKLFHIFCLFIQGISYNTNIVKKAQIECIIHAFDESLDF